MNKLQRYKCNHCDAVFSHRQSKFKHELNCKKRTSTPNLFKCDSCEKQFSRKDVLLKHKKKNCKGKKKESVFSCSICLKEFNRKKNLERHFVIHSKKKYTCDICSEEYERIDHYQKHKCKCFEDTEDIEDTDFNIQKAFDASITLFNEEDGCYHLSMAFSKKNQKRDRLVCLD